MTFTSHPSMANDEVSADGLFYERYGGAAPDNYERYFVPVIGAPLAADLIDVASPQAGERVLDVACGTGTVSRLAVGRVGTSGSVTGLDLNAGMLAVARARTPAEMRISWHEGRAERLPLPDGVFDLVLCQLGLQFFSERAGALYEMWRVLAPGGRLIFNVPGPTPAVFTILEELLRQHAGEQAAAFVRAVFSLYDRAVLTELLASAGFQAVSINRATKRLRLPAPADFLWQYVCSTPLASLLSTADRQTRARLENAAAAALEPFTESNALLLQLELTTASACKFVT
jgi:ubiquinone/menaquinone biosynthesis C-methylase UbiE